MIVVLVFIKKRTQSGKWRLLSVFAGIVVL